MFHQFPSLKHESNQPYVTTMLSITRFIHFRVRLGYLSDFLSTSCITDLHFIPDSDEGQLV